MIIRKKYNLAETCFYIFWCFLQIGKGLGYTSRDTEFLILVGCALPFAIGKLLLTKWENRDILSIIFLYILGIIVTFFSGTTTYLLSILCVTAVKGMDIKKVLKVNLAVRGPLFVFRTTAAILGFADMQMRYRYENGAITATRYALGYDHPNTAQFELFMLVVLFFVLYSNRVKIYHYIVAFVYCRFIYTYTDSRTTFFLTPIFLAGTFLAKWKAKKEISRIISRCSSKIWVISILISFLGCYAYTYVPQFRSLGTFASRFLTATSVMHNNSIPLFGTSGITTDLGFIYILYDGGIILSMLFFAGIIKLLALKKMRNETVLHIAFICLAMFNLLESYTYSVLSNGLLLYLAYVVFPSMGRVSEVGDTKSRKIGGNEYHV